MHYRLGLDLGSNSIGWCVLELQNSHPASIVNMGVRVFSEGREGKSKDVLSRDPLSVKRRLARSARKRRDRFLRRQRRLMEALVRHGLAPEDPLERQGLKSLDPFNLRHEGLRHKLTLFELGRAIFHLGQHRGFKSNRKADAKEKEPGKIRQGIERLLQEMEDNGAETFGDLLYMRREQGQWVRARRQGAGANAFYDIYPDRSLIAQELNLLWERQSGFHGGLDPAALDEIRDVLLFQRPLKPVTGGKCILDKNEERAPAALPTAQRFRILQELNNLRLIGSDHREHVLALEHRNLLLQKLLKQKTMTFDSMRKALGLDSGWRFNLESSSRPGLKGDEVAGVLSALKVMGKKRWSALSLPDREELVELLLEAENEQWLVEMLEQRFGFDEQTALAASRASLPDARVRLGPTALCKVTAELERSVIPFSEAVVRAGYVHHSHFPTGEVLDRLPYYGQVLDRHVCFGTDHPKDPPADRFGRIANPTLHIGLNQLRRVVNSIIKIYGHPEQVVVEVARELKNSRERRQEIAKSQGENKLRNDNRLRIMRAEGIDHPPGDAIQRMKLWEELGGDPADRRCVYTGEVISLRRLFSEDVEIEHILPFSRTLDNSLANRTVCLRRANRDKGRKTPWEAFGASPGGYDWDAILKRAAKLPRNKRWRFGPEAMERYNTEEADFLARQLHDTAYLSRVAKEYLCCICDPRQVWVTPGRLTALLANKWGLPPKDRDDHRHHARDAALIGVMDRSLLKAVADARAREEDAGSERFLAQRPEPWPGFREELLQALDRVVVSHRPDHGLGGQLFKDTAYGLVSEGRFNVVHRKPIEDLAIADLAAIRDQALAGRLLAHASGMAEDEARGLLQGVQELPPRERSKSLRAMFAGGDAEFKAAMSEFGAKTGVRRLRVLDVQPGVVPVRHGPDKQYAKGLLSAGNAYYAIAEDESGRWFGEVVSYLQAAREGFKVRKDIQDRPLCMALFRNDLLELEVDGTRRIMKVAWLSEGMIALAEHMEANVDARNRDKDKEFSYNYVSPSTLGKVGARQVHVNELGEILYPGRRGHGSENR